VRVTLSLTHRCNLACRYCYSGNRITNDMEIQTAKKIIDFAIANTPPDQRLEFGFFGGEPFLCFEKMGAITNYLKEVTKRAGLPFQLSITTNGTILTEPILNYLKNEKVSLCVSIDGHESVHNKNRIFPNGKGSHAIVAKNMQKFVEQLDFVQVNAVYGPDTIKHLPELLPYFIEAGVQIIHFNPNITATWSEEAKNCLNDVYMQVADDYIQYYKNGYPVTVNLIDSKVLLFLKDGYSLEDRCGMGETELGFAPSGNIYPCERFIGEDQESPFCIGNIYRGLNTARHCAVLKQRGNRNEECQMCPMRNFCMNWCGCTNYYMTGQTDLASSMLCVSERATILAAKHVFLSLKENNLFIDHLMTYVHEGRHLKYMEKK
jgi:uncharacterized protein